MGLSAAVPAEHVLHPMEGKDVLDNQQEVSRKLPFNLFMFS